MDEVDIYELCRPLLVYRTKNEQRYDLSLFLEKPVELFSIDVSKSYEEQKRDFDCLSQQISHISSDIRYKFWLIWKKILQVNAFIARQKNLKDNYNLNADHHYFEEDLNRLHSEIIMYYHDFFPFYKFHSLADVRCKKEALHLAFRTCFKKPI